MVKYGSFKYKVIKRLYNRAVTFRDEANTTDKFEAWGEVVEWLESFYSPKHRCLSKNGVICSSLRKDDIEKIKLIEDQHGLRETSD